MRMAHAARSTVALTVEILGLPPRCTSAWYRLRMLEIIGIRGLPEILPGDDLCALFARALGQNELTVQDGDIFVFTSKIVSKAEGRIVALTSIVPSPFASAWAEQHGKDPRQVEVVLRETRRIVRMDRGLIIAETYHGFICANAGVDHSNSGNPDELVLLPLDSDSSARRLRQGLLEQALARPRAASPDGSSSPDIAVIISDTFGRAWRLGQTNIAIGSAGIKAVRSYVGQDDPNGVTLRATGIAVVDELAGAAELAMGKLDRVPVALIRGYDYPRVPEGTPDEGASALVRAAAQDLFR
jgi:coenzyme F420-0:L-glutamate ligase / coenzyme F420-1:gamma-L-glutamate ligase